MQLRTSVTVVLCLASVLATGPAFAQSGGLDPATGETYHVEVGGYLWNASPQLLITSESLGIIGSTIDFVDDFGIEDKTFRQLRVVGRPGRKHKFRFEYTPIGWSEEARLSRSIIFNGQRFDISLPVLAELKWNAMRFTYEWDFFYRDRGFVGLVLEAKYTDVEAALENSLIGREFVRARAPIPALGIIGRGYVAPNVSITGEFTGFKLPDVDEDYQGNYYDFDLYGTVNFTDNFGAQVGYRTLTVFYRIDDDEGDFRLKGLYFGGVARF
jgi:hypothetical protein